MKDFHFLVINTKLFRRILSGKMPPAIGKQYATNVEENCLRLSNVHGPYFANKRYVKLFVFVDSARMPLPCFINPLIKM